MSEVAETPQGEPQVPAAPSAEEYAALVQKVKSYEGRDAALTRVSKEKDQLAADLEATRAKLAAAEKKEMSDLEVAQRERDEARKEAATAREEANRSRLEAKYPNAAKQFEGEDLPSERALELIEKGFAAPTTPAIPEPPTTPPPNPGRGQVPTTPQTAKDKLAALDALPMPAGWFRAGQE